MNARNVSSIKMRRFMGHLDSTVELPAAGIVLVTGENGEGKSSLVEAVSWAGWGKTLRGDVPWWDDAKDACAAMVTFGELTVLRTRKGQKNDLTFSGGAEFPTASKAQADLESMLGDHELWRKTCVFSSADAMHFTLASDGDRKRLIESFLGGDRFDPALEACRAELKKAEARLDLAQRQRDIAAAKVKADHNRLVDAEQGLAVLKTNTPEAPVRSTGHPLAWYDERIKSAKREVYDIESKLREADRAGGSFDAEARNAKQLLDRLHADRCPTCTQAIDPKLRADLQSRASQAKAKADSARAKAKAGLAEVEGLLQEINADLEALQAQRNERAAQIRLDDQAQSTFNYHARNLEVLTDNLRAAREGMRQAKAEVVAREEEIDEASGEVGELRAVEHVLGLKGVRAHILGQSLSGIEAVANAWLARLRQGMQVKLSPYSTKADGGTKDSISLQIIGKGRGSYKSASQGERRRVDVALLLGLAEVSAAAHGIDAGTIFFDEVFDCLDGPGVEAVTDILAELAQTRCVVLITHSVDLISRVRVAKRLHVSRGQIQEVTK